MGRSQSKKKYEGEKLPFVQLPWDILNSQAYRQLPPSAAKALPYFLGKVRLPFNHKEKNFSSFHFTYPEAGRHGFAKATFWRIIIALVDHGFVNPVEKGGLRGDGKSNSVFRLSSRWKNFGKTDFEVIRWKEFI